MAQRSDSGGGGNTSPFATKPSPVVVPTTPLQTLIGGPKAIAQAKPPGGGNATTQVYFGPQTNYGTNGGGKGGEDQTQTQTQTQSGGGGGGIKKSDDKPQVAALARMLKTEFAKARDTKIGNINLFLKQSTADVLKSYEDRAGALAKSGTDNDKAESDASFANLVNRARELADIREQAAIQGAGESDTAKAQMMALRNWDANQGEVNRSYFDTARAVGSAIVDLNADTRTALFNAHAQANSDREQVWTNFYNQKTDAWTQMGNIQANPYSNAYKKGSPAFGYAATSAGQAWKSPGVPESVRNWEGTVQATEGRLNNTQPEAAVTNLAAKKPEGATLRKW